MIQNLWQQSFKTFDELLPTQKLLNNTSGNTVITSSTAGSDETEKCDHHNICC